MTKVVTAELKANSKSSVRSMRKRVKQPDGSTVTISVVDSRSETFAEEFQRAFARNVARLRRENRALSSRAKIAAE